MLTLLFLIIAGVILFALCRAVYVFMLLPMSHPSRIAAKNKLRNMK